MSRDPADRLAEAATLTERAAAARSQRDLLREEAGIIEAAVEESAHRGRQEANELKALATLVDRQLNADEDRATHLSRAAALEEQLADGDLQPIEEQALTAELDRVERLLEPSGPQAQKAIAAASARAALAAEQAPPSPPAPRLFGRMS